jgi:Conjugal transfer protein TraD
MIAELRLTLQAIKRTKAMVLRIEASQRRTDKREWVMHRRERTRHLIELGGLVQKAGLVELTDDDRAVLLGAFLSITDKLQSEHCNDAITLWRRRGNRAFGSKFDGR